MSPELSLPALRLADEGPPQPVEVVSVDNSVALGCTACSEELRLPLEPVSPMLDAIGDFVRRHASCQ